MGYDDTHQRHIKEYTYCYSKTIQVIPDGNCSGIASLSLYMNLELEVWLHYNDGLIIQMKNIGKGIST